jgi:murein DD-endopeptidase MepM/ murein hydrolase activator NlpD
MRLWAGALIAIMAASACVAAETPAPPEPAPEVQIPRLPSPISPPAAPTSLTLDCAGAFTQGGVALCRTLPGAQIYVDGVARGAADAGGWAVVGFDRDASAQARVEARAGGASVSDDLAIAPRTFDIQRVDGLPQQTVTPNEPAVLERIARERDIKNGGFASRAAEEGWLDGFILPVEGGRVSGAWGNQRVLNGTPSSPHFGYDIAAPIGTPIRAPAAGVVSLAQPDMHYEGGLIFIDHGQGLITMYLHMSRLDVAAGDRVEQGQIIGAVGDRGRATGPHLCWRMKWRDRNLDPSIAIDGLERARTELSRR